MPDKPITSQQEAEKALMEALDTFDTTVVDAAVKGNALVAGEALHYLDSFGPENPATALVLVESLSKDERPETARQLIALTNKGRIPGQSMTGKAFERINWTLNPPSTPADTVAHKDDTDNQ